jgi:Holliday junction DNA helicase RuvB
MSENNYSSVNDAAPVLLQRLHGQKKTVGTLQMHLNAYWNDRQAGKNPSFGPVGLFGPPGVGKTLVAHALHSELGNTKFVEVIGESLDHKDGLYATLMELDENSTFFVDEAQGLCRSAQHILLKVLAERKLSVPSKFKKKDYQIDLPPFVSLFASTHEYTLQPALRSRIRIYARMNWYSPEDLARIIQQRAEALHWRYEDVAIFQQIADRAKKSPRLGLRLLETCYHVARSQEAEIITPDHVQEAFRLSDVNAQGLDALERSYLQALLESDKLRLNVIAARLGLPTKTIQDVVEPYLLQEGYISKDGSERILLEKGKKHINGPFV